MSAPGTTAFTLRLDPENDRIFASNLRVTRAQRDETTFDAAWMKGYAMPLEQALGLALDPVP